LILFAVAQSGDTQAVRGRIALILVDISGSMNQRMRSGQTRFETAKAALAQFLQGSILGGSCGHCSIRKPRRREPD
jgi:hypothetical protein